LGVADRYPLAGREAMPNRGYKDVSVQIRAKTWRKEKLLEKQVLAVQWLIRLVMISIGS
jgi:hypothetical protein